MADGLRDRVLGAVARLGTDRPGRVLLAALLVVAAFAVLVPQLEVSTSRTGLIAEDDPQQQRMIRFWEAFGRPDSPLFVVSGGTLQDRRAAVDRLQTALEAKDEFRGRVLGRVWARDVGSIALLHQPDAVSQLVEAVPPGTDLPALLEGGLVEWMGALQTQIEAGLEGAQEEEAPDAPVDQAVAGLGQLATMARVLDDVIGGRDALARFGGRAPIGQRGIDENGYLVTDDGEHNLVAIYVQVESDEGRVLQPLVERLRGIRDETLTDAPEGVTADLTGLPAIAVDELAIVQAGLVTSSVAATIGIALLCLALFRSVRQTIVALLPLLPGIVVTLGAVRLMYGDLNLITSSFVAVLLGLGIDFSVHLIARRNEELRAGNDDRLAISVALRRAGPGIVTGAVITAAAFLTNRTTDFTAYGELGIITAVGLIVIMVATLVLIPPLLVVGRKGMAQAAPEPPGIGAIPGFVRKTKVVLLAIGVGLGIAGGIALPTIGFDARYFGFLPEETESAHALEVLEYDALASPVFAVLTVDTVEEAREKATALQQMGSVAGVQSPSDLLPPLTEAGIVSLREGFAAVGRDPDFDKLAAIELTPKAGAEAARGVADGLDEVRAALRRAGQETAPADDAFEAFDQLAETIEGLDDAGKARLAGLHADAAAVLGPAWRTAKGVAARGHYLPRDVPSLFATRFVSKDGTKLALYAVPAGSFWEKDVAERFSADVRTVDDDVAGLAMVHVAHGQIILQGFRRAALFAAAIIIVLLIVDFRSLTDALLALLPTVLGWLWMLAAMAGLGLVFNVANIVALPLVLGIGIAFGVHMMHRQRESTRPRIDDVIRGTGGAIAVAATTTMVGFAGLMLSDYGGMRSLGLLMVMGIGTCLLATVLILPAVLLILKRAE